MTLIASLFGGLLLIVAVSLVLRRLGMPAHRAAVISGGLPLIAYFVHALVHWPGLDVFAIHLAVYATAAYALFHLSDGRRGGRQIRYGLPLALGIFFASLFLIYGALAMIATQGLPEPLAQWLLPGDGGRHHTGFAGVVGHGGEAAKTIASEMKTRDAVERRGWRVEIRGLNELQPGRHGTVALRLTDAEGHPVRVPAVVLRLLRPGIGKPFLIQEMDHVGESYVAHIEPPADGTWIAVLVIRTDTGDVLLERTLRIVRGTARIGVALAD